MYEFQALTSSSLFPDLPLFSHCGSRVYFGCALFSCATGPFCIELEAAMAVVKLDWISAMSC